MKQNNFIYIGPTIPSLGLKKNTLYRSEKPPGKLEQIGVLHPIVLALYISTKNLAEVSKRLNQKGSLEYTATQEMLAIAKK